MAKRKFRIEGGNYGGECVIGEVKNAFVQQAIDLDEGELIDRVLEAEEWEQPEPADIEEHEDPEAVVIPRDDYYMWECDDIEHINGPYADGGFTVYEVPADGSDDYDYDKEIWSGEAIHMYGREGGYFGTEEPDEVTEELVPVLAFMSSEKGTFGVWFIEQDDDFDPYKLGFGVVETNLGEFVDRVYYDKVELDAEYDYNDTTGKSYHAEVGWLNKKWHDPFDKYDELDEDYLNDFDDNAKWEREQNEE
jgi:hypothetical protein